MATSKVLGIRLSDERRKEIEDGAAQLGITPSEYARRLFNRAAPVALDQATAEWIEAALKATPHGEIILTVQDHKVMGVDIRGRRRVLQPAVDKCRGREDTSQ